jgi:hypothetical protein
MSRYNTVRKEMNHKFSFEIQVVFGDKGNNLTFKNIVNGNVVSTANIEFDKQ